MAAGGDERLQLQVGPGWVGSAAGHRVGPNPLAGILAFGLAGLRRRGVGAVRAVHGQRRPVAAR